MKAAKKIQLHRYDDSKGNDQQWVKIHEIVVETEEDKRQLLLTSEYIHGLRNIDTEIMGANVIAHLYCRPDLIKVRAKK